MDFSADILARAMFFYQNGTFSPETKTDDLDEDIEYDLYYSDNVNGTVLLVYDNVNGTYQWGTVTVTQFTIHQIK